MAFLVAASCRSVGRPGGVNGRSVPAEKPPAGDGEPSVPAPAPEPEPDLDESAIAGFADDLVSLYGPTVATAMMVLSRAGSAAVPELAKRLSSKDPTMRSRALVVLGRIGDRSAEPAVRALLEDPSQEIRVAARIALLRLGSRDELPALLEIATRPEPASLRAAALSGLSTQRLEDALPAFREGLRAAEANVRFWSVQGIRTLEDRASAGELVTLLCDANEGVAGAAADALRALRAPAVHADVAKAFSVTKGPQRAAILELLRDLGHESTAAFVRQSVSDESAAVRATAMRLALDAAPQQEAAAEWLEVGSRDPDSTVRSLALRGLSLAGGPGAAATLARALFDEDPFCRMNAALGLARVGASDRVGDLRRVEEGDAVSVVRGAARRARARLGDTTAVPPLIRDLDDVLLRDGALATLRGLFEEDLGVESTRWKAFWETRRDSLRYDAALRRYVTKSG